MMPLPWPRAETSCAAPLLVGPDSGAHTGIITRANLSLSTCPRVSSLHTPKGLPREEPLGKLGPSDAHHIIVRSKCSRKHFRGIAIADILPPLALRRC
ncbi:hypothetical protein M430DRAFT_181289 [Amorphotheca resinae ATCC 22711]|uniref:Uncharacterized protein n=1 Tax=Amorphotheca resinae ATCC 22711 TaxID=857342 RepID=A0A2T3ARE9_AMORE|nr:hypothetical protein M430DRAFT_181289 [Amorphotheca resinae ATCC 22711]PSS08949.1 hypothetical protein M430DRAFT_181289 [Amorphotheca resinae ATCC 22711]